MPLATLSQFISSIKPEKADDTLLTQHDIVQGFHTNANGPNLDDKCTNRVRYEEHHELALHPNSVETATSVITLA